MAIATQLLTAAQTGDQSMTPASGRTLGQIVYPQVTRDQIGYMQVDFSASPSSYTLELQARFDDNAPWSRIGSITNANITTWTFDGQGLDAGFGFITISLPMLPQLNLVVVGVVGATVSAWLVE